MSKHTDGPWVREESNVFVEKNGMDVSIARGGVENYLNQRLSLEERDANVDLIAAAPCLYTALKGMVSDGDTTQEQLTAALDALAKAEGKTR